jgi:NAD+ kinase
MIKIYCIAADSSIHAQKVKTELLHIYSDIFDLDLNALNSANLPDIILVLGGDGFMLHVVHSVINICGIDSLLKIKFYGMNFGTVGFLHNVYNNCNNVLERILSSKAVNLFTICAIITTANGNVYTNYAINEITIMRKTLKTVHIRVTIDNIVRINKLISDGVLISTNIGSTAYNFAAGGPILPFNSNLISLTSINTFRPRFWKNALLDNKSRILFDILNHEIRPINAIVDCIEYNDVIKVDICCNFSKTLTLLFDSEDILNKKLIDEQFIIE